MKYVIQDWAGNTLQHDGKFNFGAYGKDKGVPMEFEGFEEAWGFLRDKFSHLEGEEYEEMLGEFHVEELNETENE